MRHFLFAFIFNLIHISILFSSEIFYYDKMNPQYLHVQIEGKNWRARDIRLEDTTFYQNLFENEKVIHFFAEGKIRTHEHTGERVNLWIKRFKEGHPHGALTILDQTGEYIGYAIAGQGEEAGACEVACAFIPGSWQKGIGSDIASKLINCWAPTVKDIGLGKGLNEFQTPEIIKSFCCFFEGEPLKRLDATASPSNCASWRILEKNGFVAAEYKLESKEILFDCSNWNCSYNEMEARILSGEINDKLLVDKRFRIIDIDSKQRTISKKGYGKLKYHFECILP
jgi:RimJ/RimL family protein N-acetyltransferase